MRVAMQEKLSIRSGLMALQCSVRHDSGKSWLNPSRVAARGTELLIGYCALDQAPRLREFPRPFALIRPRTPGVAGRADAAVFVAIRTDTLRGTSLRGFGRCFVMAAADHAKRGGQQDSDP